MLQIDGGFLQGSDSEEIGLRGPSEAFELRKNKPHPMSAFAAAFEFRDHAGEDGVLRIDKTLQIVGFVHVRGPVCGAFVALPMVPK
jgi:hypothetical protein